MEQKEIINLVTDACKKDNTAMEKYISCIMKMCISYVRNTNFRMKMPQM